MIAIFANTGNQTESVVMSRQCQRGRGKIAATISSCFGVLLFCLTAPSVLAHTDPPGAVDAAVSHALGVHFDASCEFEIAPDEVIAECQTVWVHAVLNWYGSGAASIEGGGWFLSAFNEVDEPYEIANFGPVSCIGDPDNSTDDPNGPGGRGSCAGASPLVFSACVPYTVTAADIARGAVVFQAVWGDRLSSPETGWAHLGADDESGQEAITSVIYPVETCDDGEFCNGAETCNLSTFECVPGTPVDADDGVGCTDDSCDEANDVVVNVPNDGLCDNGQFCDGSETCDAVNDCQVGTPPCDPATETCDESGDICEPIGCQSDAECDNGAFCDGAEICDLGTGECVPGTPVDADDGVGCTDDSCDEANDVVVNVPNDGLCDNGQFCDGSETCDAVNDCQVGTPPCDPATETCDESGDICEPIGAVFIDIKFCSDPNAFNCKKRGVLPVTIFGNDFFDGWDIDVSSLQLCSTDGGCVGPPVDYFVADRGTPPGDLGAAQCAINPETGEAEDFLSQDLIDDLDAAFDARDVQEMLSEFCSGPKGGVSSTLYVTGTTVDGISFISVPISSAGVDQLVKADR